MRLEIHVYDHTAVDLSVVMRKLDKILEALKTKPSEVEIMGLFDDTRAKVQKLTDASEAMDTVLKDVKSKLDAVLSSSNLTAEDRQALTDLGTALDTESDKIIADTLANTPAAPSA